MGNSKRPLLGYLAGRSWLSQHGEVLAVQALVFFLNDARCREALASVLCDATGIAVPPGLTWRAESVEDEGRPDLVGSDADEHPRIVVEAKFAHRIDRTQLLAYQQYLARHPTPHESALLLLVPEHRRAEANRALTAAPDPARTAVVSWDVIIDAFRHAAKEDALLLDDIRQFEGLCETYGGKDIRPFTSTEDIWPARAKDLKVIVDRVTAELSSDRLLPIGSEKDATTDGLGYYRRYVSGERGDAGAWMSIGVRQPRSGFDTPIWLRYHARTPDFAEARTRLEAAPDVRVSVAQRGHVYVPLELPLGVSGVEVVEKLKEEAQRVHSVALGRPWATTSTH